MGRNFNKNPITIAEIVEDMERVAQEADIPVEKLTITQYTQNGGDFGETTIRRKGGWAKIKSIGFRDTEKDLATIDSIKKQTNYVSKLESKVGEKLNLEQLVRDTITKLDIQVSPTKKLKKVKSKEEKVHMVAMLNDVHYGMQVDPEENGNLNSYNWKEASRRTALFIKEIADYKSHKRDQVEKLHLIINGDLLEGVLRGGVGNDQDLLVHQLNGAIHILTHAIEYLLEDFDKIDLHCLAGNHDRMPHKNQGHRPTSEIYDSYAHIVYYALSTIFKKNQDVNFFVPKTPYGFIDLPGGRLMYLHGDGLWAKDLGNPGRSINVKSVSSAIREFNAGEMLKGNEPVKIVLVGHTHSYVHFLTTDGVEVCVAPSLCGLNGFAHMLNINRNLIAQLVFESTKSFIFGDSRLVRVNDADNDPSLDKIIPTYNKGLKWS